MNFPSFNSQPHIPTGSRVSTPAGPGTFDGFVTTYERGSTTEIHSVTAVVWVNGKRQYIDVHENDNVLIPVSGGAVKLGAS